MIGILAKIYAKESLECCVSDDERHGLEEIVNHTFTPCRENCLELWEDSSNVLFSHICGQLFYEKYADALLPICTPVYTLSHDCIQACVGLGEDTERGHYRALVVVHRDNVARFTTAGVDWSDEKSCCKRSKLSSTNLRSLAGSRLAINAADSYSGCVSIRNAVALPSGTVSADGANCSDDAIMNIFFHPDVLVTGSHRASVTAVARGEADVASIDCTTWAVLARHCPQELSDCAVIGATAAAPAPPFVVGKQFAARCPQGVEALRRATLQVLGHRAVPLTPCSDVDADALTTALEALGIEGAEVASSALYIDAFRAASSVAGSAVLSIPPPDVGVTGGSAGTGYAASLDRLSYFERVDLCGYRFSVPFYTTGGQTEEKVRRWVDRAMLLGFGFNHEAGVFCFEQALLLDADCALAHWGIAYNSGENYNVKEVEPADTERARAHVAKALTLIATAPEGRYSSLEVGLIGAIKCRCELVAEEADAMTLNYCSSMRALYDQHPPNCDLAALFAESLINIRPWRLWEPRTAGLVTRPAHPDTEELGRVLQAALERSPRHPGLSHLYVHYGELGPRHVLFGCVDQAHMLRSQWPFLGHLLHMASHIDMQVGLYQHAILCNREGISQDIAYNTHRTPAGERDTDHYYHGYRIHNGHMLVWAAMFDGNYETAMAAADANYRSTSTRQFCKWISYMEPYLADAWHILVRFGRWDDIIKRPLRRSRPGAELGLELSVAGGDGGERNGGASGASMVWETIVDNTHDSIGDNSGDDMSGHEERVFLVDNAFGLYAKGIAHAALGQVARARELQALFRAAVKRIPESRCLHNVPSSRSMQVADCMLAGEISYAAEDYDYAFAHLRQAVSMEEQLPYDEPPG